MDIKDHVKTIIEAEIIKGLNNAPEAIEKLVKAALSKPVDLHTGGDQGYYVHKVPYLDFLVGDEIRAAARAAVKQAVQDLIPTIEAEVRKGLTGEAMVQAIVKSFLKTAEADWRINVSFEADKDR